MRICGDGAHGAPRPASEVAPARQGVESLVTRGGCNEDGGGMSIKADRWIRRMAREHRMIEPFTDQQVRKGVISYGLSSYGYDVRIADEFKIFTNINSTMVDPKNFDPRSFVDFKGDVCIIPPNSFALAQTVEYFRIPRNVLTVCVGKCLAGDTTVVDAATGALRPIAEFAERASQTAAVR